MHSNHQKQICVPVLLDKRSFLEPEYYVAKFNRYEPAPMMNEEVQPFEDEFKLPHFLTKIDSQLFCAPTRESYHKKNLILVESRNGRMVVSRIVKELFFTHKVPGDADEMHTKTLMLMKHRRIINRRKKKRDESDLTESEGFLNRLAERLGQRA